MSNTLKIDLLRMSNILGIENLEFKPGGFNNITGPNGAGKTSILEAIKAATGTGHDATLLRKGAATGEVVLVLDDGTKISKRVTATGSKTDIIDAAGAKVKKPADFMRALVDTMAVNPIEFLSSKKSDRVKVLLEAMPITVDVERLERISGIQAITDGTLHGLAIIDDVRSRVYSDRTGTNRAVKEKDNTINQLTQAMPEVPGGVDGNEDELRAQLEAATNAKDGELERVRLKLDKLTGQNQAKVNTIRDDLQAKIDQIRNEAQAQIDKAKADAQAEVTALTDEFAATERAANKQRELTNQRHNDVVAPLNQALESIRVNRSAHAKREQAQQTIKQMEAELIDLQQDAAAQTKALSDIDAYKMELLAALPIPGVVVTDGEIYRDGIIFERLNTAQQVGIAVEIAKLRSGDLGICCVDRLECLDPEAFEAFCEQMNQSGLQLFVTTVSGEEFGIHTDAE